MVPAAELVDDRPQLGSGLADRSESVDEGVVAEVRPELDADVEAALLVLLGVVAVGEQHHVEPALPPLEEAAGGGDRDGGVPRVEQQPSGEFLLGTDIRAVATPDMPTTQTAPTTAAPVRTTPVTLKATHPFESRWYTWLLGLRPVWYYRNGYLPYGMKASIAGMAGPVIWLVGLAAPVGLLWHQVSGRGSRQGAGVLILYGTQLIPWMLVTRCTFLYHYFPSSMFCLAALALVLARMKHVDWAKKIAAGLCVVALVLFVLYYPALSGLPIPAWWADALNVLPSFGFY